jgi:hypothetical protein
MVLSFLYFTFIGLKRGVTWPNALARLLGSQPPSRVQSLEHFSPDANHQEERPMRSNAKKSTVVALFISWMIGSGWLAVAGAARLEDLVLGARKEGELNVMLPSAATLELVRGLEAAMNLCYGLRPQP